jgi:hypothetical protein
VSPIQCTAQLRDTPGQREAAISYVKDAASLPRGRRASPHTPAMELQRKEYPGLLVRRLCRPELQLLTAVGCAAAAAGRRRPQWAHEARQPAQCAHCRLAAGACPSRAPQCGSSWQQERRRVEDAYVQGLRKLASKRPPDDSSDLGYAPVPAPSRRTRAD